MSGIILIGLMCVHHVFGTGTEEYFTGYSGQSVVLKSGVDGSWILSKVRWSVYENTTYIAILKDGKETLYNVWRYQGRLRLNKRTGDLTIRNLTMGDSMIYTVNLVNQNDTRRTVRVHLTVQEQLKEPDVQMMFHSFREGRCHMALNCTGFGQNVKLSWTPEGEFNGTYISENPNSGSSTLVLFISIGGNRTVRLNCTASSGHQTATAQTTAGCSGKHQKGDVCDVHCSCVSSVMWTLVLTALLVLALEYALRHQDVVPRTIRSLRGTSSRDSGGAEDTKGNDHCHKSAGQAEL